MSRLNVAIDGPVGSGKTTVGKLLAEKLNYNFLDSGLLYRHFAQFYQENFINQVTHSNLEIDMIGNDFSGIDKVVSLWKDFVTTNQENLVDYLERNRSALNSPLISDLASRLSPIPKLRKIILEFQRNLTKDKGWVVVGRDITSEVLPDAKIKIFLTANLEMRAKRRTEQHQGEISQEEVEKELKKRDNRDVQRSISPLKKSSDSYELDTTYLSPQESVGRILNIIKDKDYNTKK